MKAPCLGCPRREVGCRGVCPDWQAYEAAKADAYARRKAASAGTYVSRSCEAFQKKRNRAQRQGRKI